MSRLATLLAAIAALISLCRPAAAEPATQIIVPLTIDYLTLGAALKRQVYDAPGGRAILWKGTNDCEFLNAYNPRFSLGAAAVDLESDGELGLGVPLAENCVGPLSWKGIIAVDAAPYLTSDLTLMFRVTDINLYDRQHQKSLIVGHGFDLIKQNFIPRFQTFKFDLRAPIEEFRALASGPLTPAELAAWDEQLDQWDAFIVFAIKRIGSTIADKEVRASLLNLLLDGRYRLAQALGQPPAPGGPDPVRVLFLDQWRRLGDVVRTAAARGQLGDRALELLSFVSAGDALMAFDQAAPALGARISAADLRRLARIMAPHTTADPLQFNYEEDTELQHIFGVTPPPLTPGSVEPSDSDEPEPTAITSASPGATPEATMTAPLPPDASSATPTPAPPAPPTPSTPTPTAGRTSPLMHLASRALAQPRLSPTRRHSPSVCDNLESGSDGRW